MEVCPVQAININDSNIQINGCIECGLCAKECPTGALKWKNPSNLSLIEKVKEYEQCEEPIYVHCSNQKLEEKNTNHIEVPCLASILSEIWLVMLNSPAQFTLYLPKDACRTCQVLTGGDLLDKDFEEAERLSKKKMLYIKSIDECQEKVIDNGMNQERRDSILYFFKKVKQAPLIALRDWASNGSDRNQEQSKISPIVSPKKEVIRYIFKNQPELQSIIKLKLPFINEKCEFCHACSKLCPNRALNQIDYDYEKVISVNPLLCSECNLCKEICFFDAISLKETSQGEWETKNITLASSTIE
jgi:Fe-S-cluster-containing hydrogenase component 2